MLNDVQVASSYYVVQRSTQALAQVYIKLESAGKSTFFCLFPTSNFQAIGFRFLYSEAKVQLTAVLVQL